MPAEPLTLVPTASTAPARRSRFVDPTTVRLDLSDGDWVEAKRGLSYAEQERISSALMRSMSSASDEIGIDWAKHRLLRLESWLTDWSFRGADGKPVTLSRAAIASLDPDTAGEINAALDAHIAGLDAAKKEAGTGSGAG